MGTSFEEYCQSKYFPALDGMRAISILLVMTVHLYYKNFSWDWLSGNAGVTIFFVLSGYLITMLATREEDEYGHLNLKAFYLRRAFRIFPPYFFVLALYCFLIFGLGFGGEYDHGRLGSALPYYLLYSNEFAPAAPFYQSWSLGIEEKFYLIWPVMAFVALRGTFIPRLIFAVVFVTLLAVIHGFYPEAKLIHYYAIALGCLLAICLSNREVFNRLRFFGKQRQVICVWIVFIVLQFSLYFFPVCRWFYPIVVASVILSVILAPPRWLSCKSLVYIGQRSYGIYLVHILCLRTVKLVFPVDTSHLWVSLLGLATGTMLSILIAELLYRLIEQPFISYGRPIAKAVMNNSAASYGVSKP